MTKCEEIEENVRKNYKTIVRNLDIETIVCDLVSDGIIDMSDAASASIIGVLGLVKAKKSLHVWRQFQLVLNRHDKDWAWLIWPTDIQSETIFVGKKEVSGVVIRMPTDDGPAAYTMTKEIDGHGNYIGEYKKLERSDEPAAYTMSKNCP